ncbi:MAG: hypothetical protein J5677_02100 [Bacteroidales bacterium]|nr:hypothetical protein [Bacteroidales bacterium]
MKKLFLALVAVFAMSTMANAQIKDLGVRVGWGGEISAMWGLGGNRLETDMGWNAKYLGLAAVYQWTWDLGSDFNWYAGVGGRLAIWDNSFALGVAGQIGLEYNFDIPLQLTLDWRPSFWVMPNTTFGPGDICLGIRYRF